MGVAAWQRQAEAALTAVYLGLIIERGCVCVCVCLCVRACARVRVRVYFQGCACFDFCFVLFCFTVRQPPD